MSEAQFSHGRENWSELVGKALQSRNFVIGATITALVAFTALLSFVWTPYDVTDLDIRSKLQWPNATHWLGTDHFGRDVSVSHQQDYEVPCDLFSCCTVPTHRLFA